MKVFTSEGARLKVLFNPNDGALRVPHNPQEALPTANIDPTEADITNLQEAIFTLSLKCHELQSFLNSVSNEGRVEEPCKVALIGPKPEIQHYQI